MKVPSAVQLILVSLCLGGASAAAAKNKQQADRGSTTTAFPALRPVLPGTTETDLPGLIEAQRLRGIAENVLGVVGGGEVLGHKRLRSRLGGTYLVEIFACAGRIPCIVKRVQPLRGAGIQHFFVGEFTHEGEQYSFKIQMLDLQTGEMVKDVSFALGADKVEDLGAWTDALAPFFAYHGTIRVLANVSDFRCTLDGKSCEMDEDGVIRAVKPGEHLLEITKEGYAAGSDGDERVQTSTRKVVQVEAGKETKVVIALEQIPKPADAPPPKKPDDKGPSETPSTTEVKYLREAGLVAQSSDQSYYVSARLYGFLRYRWAMQEKATEINGFEYLFFGILRGTVFHPSFGYTLYLWARHTLPIEIQRLFVEWNYFTFLRVRFGQAFLPYDCEWLIMAQRPSFPERSIAVSYFSPKIGTGLYINGKLFDKRLAYDIYTINTEPKINTANHSNHLNAVARLMVNVLGENNYVMTDLNRSADPNLAIAAFGSRDPAWVPPKGSSITKDMEIYRYGADLGFRWLGFSMLAVAHGLYNTENKIIDRGVVAQGSFMILPQRLEVVGRFAGVQPRGALGLKKPQYATAGGGTVVYVDGFELRFHLIYEALLHVRGKNLIDHSIMAQWVAGL
ncbi:MAG: carboxypeptidase regulatory-like domain-containing protein [Deltaproteobacteria bacterium]|nr:carboxypeptidase regulatory-like domain-containing protein [Deltaproteobacteria bacterium]